MPPERSQMPGDHSLEARLRGLPPPPVPADLEARLLSAIPTRVSVTSASGVASAPRVLPARTQPGSPGRWRWVRGAGVAGALAACLLIVLAWPKGDGQKPVQDHKGNGVAATNPVSPISPKSPQDVSASWVQVRKAPDDLKLPPFTWPVDETTHVTLSSSIPSDLLD